MNKWSFSLLVLLSVLNPIVTSVRGEVIDGYRERCAELEPLPTSRIYGTHRSASTNKNSLNNRVRINENPRPIRSVNFRSESNTILRDRDNGRTPSLRQTSGLPLNIEERRQTSRNINADQTIRDNEHAHRQTTSDSFTLERSRFITRNLMKREESRINRDRELAERSESNRRDRRQTGNRRSFDLIRSDSDYRRIWEEGRQNRNGNELRRTTSEIRKDSRRLETVRAERRSRSFDENRVNRQSGDGLRFNDFELRRTNERNSNSRNFNVQGIRRELNRFSDGRNHLLNLDRARNGERSARTEAKTRHLQDSRFEQIRYNRAERRSLDDRRYRLVNDKREVGEAERWSISETRNVDPVREVRSDTQSKREINPTGRHLSNLKLEQNNIRALHRIQESRHFLDEGRRAVSESRTEERNMVRDSRFENTRKLSNDRLLKWESRNVDRRITSESDLNRRDPIENRINHKHYGQRQTIRDFRNTRIEANRGILRASVKSEAKEQYITFGWQYIIYAFQTIYVCGIIAKFMKGNVLANKKGLSRSSFLNLLPWATKTNIKAE